MSKTAPGTIISRWDRMIVRKKEIAREEVWDGKREIGKAGDRDGERKRDRGTETQKEKEGRRKNKRIKGINFL